MVVGVSSVSVGAYRSKTTVTVAKKNIFHAVADALPPPDQHQPPLSSSFPEGNAAITPAGPEPVSNAIIITNGGDALLSSLFVALRGW